jgi:hypothetical protein
MAVGLPAELIMTILEYLYFKDPDTNVRSISEPDYCILSACSLVCQLWSGLAQSLAFRELPLCGSVCTTRGSQIYAAINPSTEQGKLLGQYVHVLNLVLGVRERGNLPDWLACCPRLYQLGLDLYGLQELSPTVIDKLSVGAVGMPFRLNIRALCFFSIGVQSLVPYQLLSICPSIQFLVLGGGTVTTPPPDLSFNFCLYELVLQRALPVNILERLLSTSETSLRVLEFKDPPSLEVVCLLAKHGPHIRSLRLMRYDFTSAALVQICTNLKELMILHVPSLVPMTSLPHSLEHVAFLNLRHLSGYPLDTITSAIDTLPNLCMVTCYGMSVKHSQFFALRAACNARGVTLRLRKGQDWSVGGPCRPRWSFG